MLNISRNIENSFLAKKPSKKNETNRHLISLLDSFILHNPSQISWLLMTAILHKKSRNETFGFHGFRFSQSDFFLIFLCSVYFLNWQSKGVIKTAWNETWPKVTKCAKIIKFFLNAHLSKQLCPKFCLLYYVTDGSASYWSFIKMAP